MQLIRGWRARSWLLASIAVVAAGTSAGVALGSGVEPATYSATVESGSSVTITKTVHTPPIPPNPDIVFLSDTTGSMEPTIENVQENAASIMKAVNEAQPPEA